VKGSAQARDLITILKPANFLLHPDGQQIGTIIKARDPDDSSDNDAGWNNDQRPKHFPLGPKPWKDKQE